MKIDLTGDKTMKRFISVLLVMIIAVTSVFVFSGCDKEPTQDFNGVRFIFEEIVADDFTLEKYASDPYRYRDIISGDFGLGEDGADKFYENFADYYIYGMTLKVLNYTGSELTFTSLESDSNGVNGVYIRKSINGGENGIGAKLADADFLADAITLHVLSANIELSDADVVQAVKGMNLTLTCNDGAQETKYDLKVEDSVEISQQSVDGGAVLNLRGLEFGVAENLVAQYASDKAKYAPILVSTYGMTEKEAEKFLGKTDGCCAYSYTVALENLCDKDIVVYEVVMEKNGEDGVYAKATLGGEMGLAAHNPETETVMPPFILNVLCTDSDMLDSDVLNVLDSAKISVTYAEKTVSGDEMSDGVGERKTVSIEIL